MRSPRPSLVGPHSGLSLVITFKLNSHTIAENMVKVFFSIKLIIFQWHWQRLLGSARGSKRLRGHTERDITPNQTRFDVFRCQMSFRCRFDVHFC